jgi:hypothetical protein
LAVADADLQRAVEACAWRWRQKPAEVLKNSIRDDLHSAFFEPADQATQHPRDGFQICAELRDVLFGYQRPAARKFEQRHAFLHRAASDDEEISPVGFGEAAVALGKVRGDRAGHAVELVGEIVVASREIMRYRGGFVGEVDGALVDVQLFEHESDRSFQRRKWPADEVN